MLPLCWILQGTMSKLCIVRYELSVFVLPCTWSLAASFLLLMLFCSIQLGGKIFNNLEYLLYQIFCYRFFLKKKSFPQIIRVLLIMIGYNFHAGLLQPSFTAHKDHHTRGNQPQFIIKTPANLSLIFIIYHLGHSAPALDSHRDKNRGHQGHRRCSDLNPSPSGVTWATKRLHDVHSSVHKQSHTIPKDRPRGPEAPPKKDSEGGPRVK